MTRRARRWPLARSPLRTTSPDPCASAWAKPRSPRSCACTARACGTCAPRHWRLLELRRRELTRSVHVDEFGEPVGKEPVAGIGGVEVRDLRDVVVSREIQDVRSPLRL